MQINSAKDSDVYKQAYDLAMEIFRISKNWPKEEKFSLIDQVRRSSRSVCANLREAWVKRRYAAHFISKLTDCDGGNSETDTWLDFVFSTGYCRQRIKRLGENCKKLAACLVQCLGTRLFLLNQTPDLIFVSDLRPRSFVFDLRSQTSDLLFFLKETHASAPTFRQQQRLY